MKHILFFLCLILLSTPITAAAQGSKTQITHPPLLLTPDKSTILELNKNVGRVILPHSSTINIVQDTARRLIVVPRSSGSVQFTILDQSGKVIMHRHAIVGTQDAQMDDKKYIRVRRSCSGDNACQQASYYYCSEERGCHDIADRSAEIDAGAAGASVAPDGAAAASATQETILQEQQNYEAIELNSVE
jgi:hypothetical protein